MVHGNWAKNSIAQLSLIGRSAGQAIINVLHFEASAVQEATLLSDALAQTWAANLAEDFRTNLLTNWRATHSQDYFLDAIRAQVLERPGQRNHKLVATENTTGLPLAGTLAVDADDLAAAAVVRWRSLLAGKHHRGRTYVGPLWDTATDKGVVQAGALASINAWRDLMITRYTGGGTGALTWVFTVYSRPYDQGDYQYTRRVGGVLTVITPPDYNGDSTFITNTVTDVNARVQRRREIGVGA